MTAIDTLRRLAMLVVLSLAQALVFNHIRLFGCAMPLLYVYFVIAIPRGYPRWATLLWSFVLGLTVDLLSNTPGAAAGALTFVGLLQPYLVELFLPGTLTKNFRQRIPLVKEFLALLLEFHLLDLDFPGFVYFLVEDFHLDHFVFVGTHGHIIRERKKKGF